MSEWLFNRPAKIVVWTDSSLQNSQVHVSEIPSPEVIVSVGWLVKETPSTVVLARDDHKDDEWRGLCAIPRCSITHIHDVEASA